MSPFKYDLFLVLCGGVLQSLPFISIAQNGGLPVNKLFARKYKLGDVYRYRMVMKEYHDNKWQLTNTSIGELKVVSDSTGVPYDEIRWISKKVVTDKDTLDQTKVTGTVKPYRISLDGKGRIDLPKIEVAEMTEPIQDFNTFFVAVSPQISGIARLQKEGDSSSVDQPVKADFSNGTSILKGEDCLSISSKLLKSTKDAVQLYTAFLAPKQSCLSYLLSDMKMPVVEDTLNNFQMLAPSGKDLYNVSYGREYFFIETTIKKEDGKIVKSEMENYLNLKIKVNCNSEYKNCQIEVPFSEKRMLTLELL
jgi:hypothetical protein